MIIMAVTHYGDKLRDADIAVAVFESREAALDALREDFAHELNRLRELGVLADPCGRRNPDTEDGLLEALRWDHNVIVKIHEHRIAGSDAVSEHLDKIAGEAHYEIMGHTHGLLGIVRDRETVTDEQLLNLTADDLVAFYDAYAGPAVDQLEDVIGGIEVV
jgi:hypothetical protein